MLDLLQAVAATYRDAPQGVVCYVHRHPFSFRNRSATPLRGLAKYYEQLSATVAGLSFVTSSVSWLSLASLAIEVLGASP